MKPILYFNSYRSLVLMGFGFSLIAFVITNYGVTVLRAAIRYLYFALLTLKDNSQMVEFDMDSLLIQKSPECPSLCPGAYSCLPTFDCRLDYCLEIGLGQF